MSKTIDDMDAAELRDALAVAAGWTFQRSEDLWTAPDGTTPDVDHPIPALDTPDALGIVAGMMPKGDSYGSAKPRVGEWEAFAWIVQYGDRTRLFAFGPTEIIARARLVLKVLAARSASGEGKS